MRPVASSSGPTASLFIGSEELARVVEVEKEAKDCRLAAVRATLLPPSSIDMRCTGLRGDARLLAVEGVVGIAVEGVVGITGEARMGASGIVGVTARCCPTIA
jgi:hypothetical protein